MTEEVLNHNPNNAVTASIRRVQRRGQSVVLKILNGTNEADTPMHWRASATPRHWNYWRREAQVYSSELTELLVGSGVRMPVLKERRQPQADCIELELEDVVGRTGADLTSQDYVKICYAWGYAQGMLASSTDLLAKEWTSRTFLRDYTTSKPVNYALLQSASAWRCALIADNWEHGLREKLTYLWRHKDALYHMLEQAQQVPCHLDFWPNNVIIDAQGLVVLIDWSFFGRGALAEDVGNFIPDSVFDGFMPPQELSWMTQNLFNAYCQGLSESGFAVDQGQLLQNLYASAVKYVWLGPLLLERAGMPHQTSYGGAEIFDANQQYRTRGVTLSLLCDWAERAINGNLR